MKLPRSLLAAVAVWAAALLPFAPAQADLSDSGVLLDRIVAVVDDDIVLQSELDRAMASVMERLREQDTQLPPSDVIQQQMLERLIIARLQLQRAARIGMQIPDEALNTALSQIAKRNGLTLGQLPAALAEQGIDYSRYREEMRREMTIEQLRLRDVSSRISITRNEVEKFLEGQTAADDDREYFISHILVSMPGNATPEQAAETEEKATRIHQRLKDGEDFGRLAVAYSSAQNAMDGGKLGWRKAEQLPTLFVDVVRKLEEGQLSDPIRSGSGFHIVRLDELRGADKIIVDQTHARHILIAIDEIVSDEDAKGKATELRQRLIDGEDFAELAREHSDDKGSGSEGGDLGWVGPGVFVGAFAEVLERLQPGQISEPFRTQFGWHIAELLGTRAHDSTDDVKRNRAYEVLRRRKMEAETEVWVRELRDQAFVEYRL